MTLFDHYLEYMTQLLEGRRSPPEGITLPEGDVTEKAASLSRQLQQVGTAAFVRACARQDGVTLPEEIYRLYDGVDMELPQSFEDRLEGRLP